MKTQFLAGSAVEIRSGQREGWGEMVERGRDNPEIGNEEK